MSLLFSHSQVFCFSVSQTERSALVARLEESIDKNEELREKLGQAAEDLSYFMKENRRLKDSLSTVLSFK